MNREDFVFFYHEYDPFGCLSNWYHAEFDYAGKHYFNSEQYMMYQKVAMFKCFDIAQQIMETDDPATAKQLGRQKFPEFKPEIWERTCRHVMRRGIRAKFLQNPNLLKVLLETDNKLLAEAAPNDTKWGIGIDLSDSSISNIESWHGSNFLGVILMEVRDSIRHQIAEFGIEKLRYSDARELPAIQEWNLYAGELVRFPAYHNAIQTYKDTLPSQSVKDSFCFHCPLVDWEYAMRTNMGGGLPIGGFYEMKQEIYDIASLK